VPEPWNVQTKVVNWSSSWLLAMTFHAVLSSTVHALLV
jgi:hypothetical protein